MLQLNWSLVFEIINLIILCLLLKKFLIKPVTAVMDKRQAEISEGLLNARNSEAEANELKGRYEDALKNARSESGRMIEEAKKRAREESDRILKEAGDQAADIMRKAEKNIESEKEKTMADLQSRIAELALTAARKVAGGTEREADDKLLYDQFLNNAAMDAVMKPEGNGESR